MIIGSVSTLTADDTDGGISSDLFVVDVITGAKTLLTASVAEGVEGNSVFGGWSPDGTTAIMESDPKLTANDTDGGGFNGTCSR